MASAVSVGVLASLSTADVRGRLDDDRVLGVVGAACDVMRATVVGLPVRGPAEVRAEILSDQNTAVERMIAAVERLDERVRASDRPLEAWLADWERVLDARQEYAIAVDGGSREPFAVPTAPDGEPLTVRIEAAAGGACDVPDVVGDPGAYADQQV